MELRPKTRKKRGDECTENDDDMTVLFGHPLHQFTAGEVKCLQSKLLTWYKQNKRDLPWRRMDHCKSVDEEAYRVLVSEVMLQQTRVVGVEQYFRRWMDRWPTFKHLALASSEDVNEMWAGLGYYARARRLHEAANKVVNDFGGAVPRTSEDLHDKLPGVGRYTAGAVASIVFKEKVAAVDGNVIRVLSRLRFIGGDISTQAVTKNIWSIAESIVPLEEPGHFNEAMMELGAVICTPKSPGCAKCPLKSLCLSYKVVESHHKNAILMGRKHSDIPDIETVPDCKLCLPSLTDWNSSLGVRNFPRKAKKSSPRNEERVVCILYRKNSNSEEDEYFLVKRPAEGLLANLWDFPSFNFNSNESNKWSTVKKELKKHHGIESENIESNNYLGEVQHIFSHIRQLNLVYAVRLKTCSAVLTSDCYQEQQWVSKDQFWSCAMSSSLKKMFILLNPEDSHKVVPGKRTSSFPDNYDAKEKKRNSTITDFFCVKVHPS